MSMGDLVIPEPWGKVLSLQPSPDSREGRGVLFLPGGLQVQAPCLVSTYSLGCGEGICYWLVRMKAPASYLAFFDTFGQGIGELYYNSLARRGSLDFWWRMRCLLWCLSGIERLLSKSFVWRGCPLSGPLGSESRFLLRLFRLPPLAFPDCWFLELQVWDV